MQVQADWGKIAQPHTMATAGAPVPLPGQSPTSTASICIKILQEGYHCHPAVLQASLSFSTLSFQYGSERGQLRSLESYACKQGQKALFVSAIGATSAQVGTSLKAQLHT